MAQPRLLQQMQLMMGAWRHEPPAGEAAVDGSTPFERRIMNQTTAEGILKLYVASSGAYEPLLKQLVDFQSALIDDLYAELQQSQRALTTTTASHAVVSARMRGSRPTGAEADAAASQGQPLPARAASAPTAADGELEDAADKCDYAAGRVANAERRMARVVEESQNRQHADERVIADLRKEIATLERQLEEQILKVRRMVKGKDAEDTSLARDELDRERRILDLERDLEAERKNVAELTDFLAKQKERVADLKELNGKYARQALELVARVRVYSEHNDKFATLLSMQHDEKIQYANENALLKQELLDLNRIHQLRDDLEGEGGTVTQAIDVRAVRYGRGVNAHVPAHLRYSGLMNRVALAKEPATTMVADILTQRQSRAHANTEFSVYLASYMKARHKEHGVAWSYSLDEATRFFDADVNLHLFGLVSRREVPEQVYRDVYIDQQIFLHACEIMDAMQHGTVRLTIPVPHIIGLLVEMYPGYPDVAFRRIADHLHATLTSHGEAHYRMLFPNLERDELSNAETSLSQVDIRRENRFSQAFKELIVDDVVLTLQQLEDEVHHINSDKVTLTSVKEMVNKIFPIESVQREIHYMLRKTVLDHHGASGKYNVAMAKPQFIALLRAKAAVRKGPHRMGGMFSANPARVKPLLANAAGKGEIGQTVLQGLAAIDYHDVLESIALKRVTYITEDDIRQEEDERKRQAELAMLQKAAEEAAAENVASGHVEPLATGSSAAAASMPASPEGSANPPPRRGGSVAARPRVSPPPTAASSM